MTLRVNRDVSEPLAVLIIALAAIALVTWLIVSLPTPQLDQLRERYEKGETHNQHRD